MRGSDFDIKSSLIKLLFVPQKAPKKKKKKNQKQTKKKTGEESMRRGFLCLQEMLSSTVELSIGPAVVLIAWRGFAIGCCFHREKKPKKRKETTNDNFSFQRTPSASHRTHHQNISSLFSLKEHFLVRGRKLFHEISLFL
jgi:hypothetical protein